MWTEGSASPVPSLPKPFIYIFWFQPQDFKKSIKSNCAISFHQNFSPTATNWKAGWCLQKSLTDQNTPSLLGHTCCPKGLSGFLLSCSQVQHRSTADERQAFSKHQTATRLQSPASYPALYLLLPCSKPPYLHPRDLDVSRSRATVLSPVGTCPCWTSYIFLPMTHKLS